MPFHCRCRKCRTRRKLARHPEGYKLQPRCAVCGARSWRVDRWMMRRDTRATACWCGGYLWAINAPHRKGSYGCQFNADGSERLPDVLTGLIPRKCACPF